MLATLLEKNNELTSFEQVKIYWKSRA